jgi:hypothetical protein
MDKKRRQGASAPHKKYMSEVAFLMTPQNVTISRDGKTLMIGKQYADFNGIVDLLKARNFDGAFELADRAVSLTRKSNGVFTVKAGIVYRDGVPVHNVISDRIMAFQEQGLPFEPLVVFLENLMKNPSERAIKELYKFLEHEHLPVTIDGCFLAYKGVRSDFLSATAGKEPVEVSEDGGKTWKAHRGHIPNKVGTIVRMDRKLVDPDSGRTCSVGLHTGSVEYATDFSERTIVVKVNPRDAVSVPNDSNGQKLRVSQYEVVAEYEKPFLKPVENGERPKIQAKSANLEPTELVQKDMTLSITGKTRFDKKTVGKMTDTLRATARKYLKLRSPNLTFGEAVVSPDSKTIDLPVHFPLDSRYKQTKATEFTAAWQTSLQKKLDPKTALLK